MNVILNRVRALAGIALLLALGGCQVELYTNLSEREANQVVAALINAGITVEKTAGRDGVTVTVEETQFAQAVDLLQKRGLPSAQYESIGDIFEKSGIISSPTEERARYIYALNQELGNTISEIDGVLSARVHVVLPEADILGRELKPSSASVFVRHVENVSVEKFTPQIKMLVAKSIEGLIYDNVSVVTIPAVDIGFAITSTQEVDQEEEGTAINYVVLISRILLLLVLGMAAAIFLHPVFKNRGLSVTGSSSKGAQASA